jgi:hypothetical protein
MHVCQGCGATVEFTIEGGQELRPSELAAAMAGTLQQALDSLPADSNSIVIARIQGVMDLLTKQSAKLFEDEQRAI